MALIKTKGSKMLQKTKQDLKDKISRQAAIIDKLIDALLQRDKDVSVLKELIHQDKSNKNLEKEKTKFYNDLKNRLDETDNLENM